MRGADLFLDLLVDEGVTHLFGNPGTTELAIMAALPRQPGLRYVLGLQESVVLAMADGYARATGTLAACNVHVAPGLGNAVGALYNAKWYGSPVLVTAGQHEQGHGLTEPLLYDPLVPIARPMAKWATEVPRVADLPRVLRRAAKVALTPPTGPVFVSLPGDVMAAAADGVERGSVTRVDSTVRPTGDALDALAERLLAAENPVLMAGHELATGDAHAETALLAELLGAPVWQQTVPCAAHFPNEHPCFMGALSREQAKVRETLVAHDLLLCVGADLLRMSLPSPVDPLPSGLSVIHIGQRDWEMGKNWPAAMALRADVRETLRALLPRVEARVDERRVAAARERIAVLRERNWSARREAARTAALARSGARPVDPAFLMLRAVEALPRDAVVVEEGLTTSRFLPALLPLRDPHAFYGLASGGLGFGVAGAVGVALGVAPRPVLCVLGDGSAMYGIQALWTAAHLGLPITYLVADNGGYRILRDRLASLEGCNTFTGMELTEPRIDFAALARSMGVAAARVEDPDDVAPALAAALGSGRPQLVHVLIEG